MMTLGGSPTGVVVPPILACTTIANSTGTGFKSISSHNLIVIGAMSSTVVTLSRKEDTSAVIMHSAWISGQILPSQS